MSHNFETCNGRIHVVKKGDTLYKLSKRYQVNLSEIISANPYVNVYNMQPGEEVCIPVREPDEPEFYEVKEGDTFETLLKNTGLSPNELFRYNEALYKIPLEVGIRIELRDR